MNSKYTVTIVIALLLAIIFTALPLVSCGTDTAENTDSQTTTDRDDNGEPSKDESDNGSALATTRYEYTVTEYSGGTSIEDLIGTISDGNGLLWYKFDESVGESVLKSSLAQARNSTDMNATLATSDGVDGGAIRFNGSTNYVKLNNGFTETSQITSGTFLHPSYTAISVAFYMKADSIDGTQLIYEQGDGNNGLAIGISDGKLIAAVGAGNSSTGTGKASSVSYSLAASDAGKWLHVAAVFDGALSGGTFTLYIDGVSAASNTGVGNCIPQTLDAAGLATAQFGTNALGFTGNCRYAGLMDDLRIYNTALSYSGELEETAIFLQSAAAKNHYVKAGATISCASMVEPTLRGFVLTYGLADKDGYSFRQTGTNSFLMNSDSGLTVGVVTTDAEKNAATFTMTEPVALPSWSSGKEGAFRSYKALGTDLFITAKDGLVTLSEADGVYSTFKVTGDQTSVIDGFRGAVYYPSYALNAPQFWKWYDHDIIDRDMGYAADILGINGFRIWVSYEYWLEDPDHFDKAFKDFLELADSHGIVIMVSLFEGCGDNYTYNGSITWNRIYAGSKASWAITSPSSDIYNNKRRWDEPKEFVKYFIGSFGNDDRLMAIETYNEPWGSRYNLAMYLTEYAVSIQGSVPLTIGSAPADPINILYSVSSGMDLIQYHDNFPGNTSSFRSNANNRISQGELANLPVYCTEVQWVGGPGNVNYPSYSNLAPTCNALMESGKWAPFYWTLMVHPCYLNSYRNVYHMYNGLINEDGTVNNKANAKAVNGDVAVSVGASTVNPYNDETYTYRYMFSDTFFDLHAYKWKVVSGSRSAESGAYVGSGLCFAKDTDFSDFTASYTMSGTGGLIFRAKDKNNFYYAEYDAASDQFVICRVTGGETTELGRSEKLNCVMPCEILLSANGSEIKISANCVELTVTDSAYTSGQIGFYSPSEAAIYSVHIESTK